MPDWIDAPYVRVYLTLAVDHPAVWGDPTLLGWWLRCLIAADRYHPAPAPLPPGLPSEARDTLTRLGIVDLGDDAEFFRFHGLAGQRETQRTRGRIGGLARAAGADRARGRFVSAGTSALGDDAGDDAGARSLVNAGGTRTNGAPAAGDAAGDDAGDDLLGTSELHQRPATPTSVTTDIPSASRSVPSSRTTSTAPTTPGRASARATRPPDDAQCSDPVAHAISHTYYPGIGWRCLACQQEAQVNDTESFRSKVERHGGAKF